MPTTSSCSPERVGCSYRGALATSSRLLVTKRVTGWQKESESGKYLVPRLIQDREPTTLTQLMACHFHN